MVGHGTPTRRRLSPILRIWSATAAWAVGLAAVATLYETLAGPPGGVWSIWWLLDSALWALGTVLPFATFAGGVAGHSGADDLRRGVVRALATAVVISAIVYGLIAFAQPMAEYQRLSERGIDVAQQRPFGPRTAAGLARQRAYVLQNPPSAHSFDVDRPLEWPPNWLTYELHVSGAWAVFAILSTLLGLLAAELTTGLSPPARRHARWAVGLLGALLFFVATSFAASAVRGSPDAAGTIWAWLPLSIPAAELTVLAILCRRRIRGLHAPHSPRV